MCVWWCLFGGFVCGVFLWFDCGFLFGGRLCVCVVFMLAVFPALSDTFYRKSVMQLKPVN